MARDFQKSRVYHWEDAVIGLDLRSGDRVLLSLEECRQLGVAVTNEPDLVVQPHPFGPGKDARGIAYGGFGPDGLPTLTLPEWARKPWIVLHEATHVVTRRWEWETGGDKNEGHGPNFMKFYIEMLVDMLGFDEGQLRASAKAHKIKVAP